MSISIIPPEVCFHYGELSDKPTLKEGWRWIESPMDWLKVRSPNGILYFYRTTQLAVAVETPDGKLAPAELQIPIPIESVTA